MFDLVRSFKYILNKLTEPLFGKFKLRIIGLALCCEPRRWRGEIKNVYAELALPTSSIPLNAV